MHDASASAAPVEVGDGGVELLVGNGLLKQYQAGDRHAVGEPCLAALEQWAEGHGARSTGQGEAPGQGLVKTNGRTTP